MTGKIETVNEWELLKASMDVVQRSLDDPGYDYWAGVPSDDVKVIIEQTTKLLDAYAALWEMSQTMMAAWEQLNAAQTIKPATAEDVKAYAPPKYHRR